MVESTQKKLSRVRKPRVQITYDVEIGEASVKRELPFVVGVLADLSGNQPSAPLKPLKERKFIEVDGGNFDEVLARMTPGVSFKVKDCLAEDDGSEMAVSLRFNSMEDFQPAQIVEQIEPLRRLLAVRNRLRDLLSQVDRSEDLETLLRSCLTDVSQVTKLTSELDEAKLGVEDETQESSEGDE